MCNEELHRRLMARQSDAELERKYLKSLGRTAKQMYMQEEIDWTDRIVDGLDKFFNPKPEK